MSPHGGLAFGLLLLGFACMVIGYILSSSPFAISRAGDEPLKLPTILLTCLVLALPMLLLLSLPSSDVFSYAVYGRIDAIYKANPFAVPPARYPSDPFVVLAGKGNLPLVSVYGPFWQWIARTVAALLGTVGTPTVTMFIYKLLGLLSLLLCTVMIWTILGRIEPGQQTRGTWLFATNPLCLLELAGSGHNDGLMMTMVLLALVLQLRGRTFYALLCLGLAIYVKWIMLLLVPGYILWLYHMYGLRRSTLVAMLSAGVIVIVLGLGLYGRNWVGWHTFTAVSENAQLNRLRNSLPDWLDSQIEPAARPAPSQQAGRGEVVDDDTRPTARPIPPTPELSPIARALKWGFGAVFGCWALLLLLRAMRHRLPFETWGWICFAYICLSIWFWPNYLIWALVFAALAPMTPMARASLLLSMTTLFLTLARAATPALQLHYDLSFAPLLVFLPPLIYAGASYHMSFRHSLSPTTSGVV